MIKNSIGKSTKKRTSKEIFAQTLLELSRHATVDRITVKQIVDESGLSLQTFYNHFRDKSELILWIHKSEGDRLIEKLRQGGGYTFRDMTMDNINFYIHHRDFFLNALTNTYGTDSYEKMCIRNAYAVFSEYICEKAGLKELPDELQICLLMYCTAVTIIYAEWAYRLHHIGADAFADYVIGAMPEKLKPYLL